MDRRMRDYMDRRMMNDRGDMGRGRDRYDGGDMRGDGRNPYGSRGGYVTSRRPRGRDRGYEDGGYYEGSFRGTTRDYGSRDYGDYGDYGDYDGTDYAAERVLTREDIKAWKHKLMKNVNDSSKQMLMDESIMKKAKSMGIQFEKFTEDELIVTVIMLFTDFWRTIGKGSLDVYIKLAEEWLCDEDAALTGGEKLAMYYDCIVEGE